MDMHCHLATLVLVFILVFFSSHFGHMTLAGLSLGFRTFPEILWLISEFELFIGVDMLTH